MTSSLTDVLELDEQLEVIALELADHLEGSASTIQVSIPPLRTRERAPQRTYRRPVLVGVAATAALFLGAFVVIDRPDGQADFQVATGSTSPTTAEPGPPSPPTAASGWHVSMDPASGFLPTEAMNLTADPETATFTPPGYRDGTLYSQHWSGAYYDAADPLAGALLFVDTDFSPAEGTPGATPDPPATFSVDTARGTVPAWEQAMPDGLHKISFRGDDEHLVTVRALGMSREDTIAAVRDLSIGANGRALMSTPAGLTAHDSDAPRNEGTTATYGKGPDTAPPGPGSSPSVSVFVSHRTDGPWLLQTALSLFASPVGSTANHELRRVTVDGHRALLRQIDDKGSVLVMYEPERRRTIELIGTGGVGADELLRLAGQLREVDDADWQAIVDRCQAATSGPGC